MFVGQAGRCLEAPRLDAQQREYQSCADVSTRLEVFVGPGSQDLVAYEHCTGIGIAFATEIVALYSLNIVWKQKG